MLYLHTAGTCQWASLGGAALLLDKHTKIQPRDFQRRVMGARPFGGAELGKSLYESLRLDPLQQESISEGVLSIQGPVRSKLHLDKASVYDG